MMHRIMLVNKMHLGKYRFLQPQEQLSLLERIAKHYPNGMLQIVNENNVSLSFYLEDGKVIYASLPDKQMWSLFDSKLKAIAREFNNDAREQIKRVFENGIDDVVGNPGYLAICWLVNEKIINLQQAESLIIEIASAVIKQFLALKEVVCEFTPKTFLNNMPKFCHLDISLLIQGIPQQNDSIAHILVTAGTQEMKKEVPLIVEFNQQELLNQKKQTVVTDRQNQNHPEINYSESINQSNGSANKTKLPNENKLYKVLCIDDSPVILKAIKGFLDEQLFEVMGVEDPLKALMQTLRYKPDIVLLDITMPHLDGYELCSLLRKHPAFRNIPIVMVTGKTSLIDKARAKMVRATGYLTKPFTKADLLKVLYQQIVDKNKLSQEKSHKGNGIITN